MWDALVIFVILVITLGPLAMAMWFVLCILFGRDVDNGRKLPKGDDDVRKEDL